MIRPSKLHAHDTAWLEAPPPQQNPFACLHVFDEVRVHFHVIPSPPPSGPCFAWSPVTVPSPCLAVPRVPFTHSLCIPSPPLPSEEAAALAVCPMAGRVPTCPGTHVPPGCAVVRCASGVAADAVVAYLSSGDVRLGGSQLRGRLLDPGEGGELQTYWRCVNGFVLLALNRFSKEVSIEGTTGATRLRTITDTGKTQ